MSRPRPKPFILIFFPDLPYEPPFDFELPDYTEVGTTLFKLAHLPPYDDRLVPDMDFPVEQIEMVPWDTLELPELGLGQYLSSIPCRCLRPYF